MEIIAEIGQNHNGDMTLARELIHAVKECGADIAKFQLYDAKALFPVEGNPWYDYNCSTELSRDQLCMLAEECAKVGVEFMASAFDLERVGWLQELPVRRHKIASRMIKQPDFIRAVLDTGVPVYVSLGMWQGEAFPDYGTNNPPRFLYCIAEYPPALDAFEFSRVDFTKYEGFSDHSIGIDVACIALARGAKIVEKHFTLDHTLYGPDHQGSMTPDELRRLVDFRNTLQKVL